MQHHTTRLCLILLAISLSACSSSIKATRIYVLNPASEATEAKHLEGGSFSAGITSLILPPYLERSQIITRSSDNQLKIAASSRWGGSLKKNITQVLVKNMATMLDRARIGIIPANSDASPDINIELEISRFERFPDGKIYLSAMWRMVTATGELLETHSSDLRSESTAENYHAIANSMSLLLADLSREISQAVIRVHTSP